MFKIYPITKNNIKKFINYLINKSIFFMSKRKLKELHNIYSDKRCFIIGNGPSLRTEDLNRIKNEVCFGSNKIYYIFDKTDWRPKYYCSQDEQLIWSNRDDIDNIYIEKKFIGFNKRSKCPGIHDAIYLNLIWTGLYHNWPPFAENICKGIYEGFTVTYMCLQIAIYMGFSKIYLIGVDHKYSIEVTPDGHIKRNAGVEDYFDKKQNGCFANPPQTYRSTMAYQAARKYADEHGIKIYNATRGGELEVFERVDFDSLF